MRSSPGLGLANLQPHSQFYTRKIFNWFDIGLRFIIYYIGGNLPFHNTLLGAINFVKLFFFSYFGNFHICNKIVLYKILTVSNGNVILSAFSLKKLKFAGQKIIFDFLLQWEHLLRNCPIRAKLTGSEGKQLRIVMNDWLCLKRFWKLNLPNAIITEDCGLIASSKTLKRVFIKKNQYTVDFLIFYYRDDSCCTPELTSY